LSVSTQLFAMQYAEVCPYACIAFRTELEHWLQRFPSGNVLPSYVNIKRCMCALWERSDTSLRT